MTYAEAAIAARAAAERLLLVANPEELAEVLDDFGVTPEKICAVIAADDVPSTLTRVILDKRAPVLVQ